MLSKGLIWHVVVFAVWFVLHATHDAVWLFIGRFTDWNLQGSVFAILALTLVMTVLTKTLGKHLPH